MALTIPDAGDRALGCALRRRIRTAGAALAGALAIVWGGGLPITDAYAAVKAAATSAEARSPNGRLSVEVSAPGGQPTYRVLWDGKEIIAPSRLGLRFSQGADLERGFALAEVDRSSHDATWEQPWGERRFVRDRHTEMAVSLRSQTESGLHFALRVRVFDDGLGFRYETKSGALAGDLTLTDEVTEFRIPGKAEAWWIPGGGWNRYEYLNRTTDLHDVERAHTPLTVRLADGPYLAFHEAALVDYPAMWLNQRRPGVLRAELSPLHDGSKARLRAGFKTPWRTIQVADAAVGLINSDLILNLNEPNVLGDVSWVRPGKYVGVWWGMHLGEMTWGSGPKHGATTERTRALIDFAAKHGFSGVLVEGWNEGWDGDWFSNGEVFSFTKPYPDFDLAGLSAYALKKGVRLVGHHETSAAVSNYEQQMEAAFSLYERLGVRQVKTGYVADGGAMTRRDAEGRLRHEWHDNQFAVNHHLRVLRAAAQRKIAINTHEPVKDTGLRRTYPNWISREGARGQEYNAWGDPVNPPEHVALLPFTRMLAGPMDYTPGIFNLTPYGPDSKTRIQSTLAQQLALYVVLYSPIQMAADLPEHYEARPALFQFIKDVPTDWAQSVALDGEVGDFVVMARQSRDGKIWSLGGVTDERARTVSVPLTFLDPKARYEAQIYRDGLGADWRTTPYDVVIEKRAVRAADTLELRMGAGGGFAMNIRRLD